METSRSFDLNRSVRQWRDSLAQSATMRTEELDELEHHLHDSMAELRARQLSDEESFLIATRRLGHGEALTLEFAKVNPARQWPSRLCWILVGVFLLPVLGSIPNAGSSLLFRWAPEGINGHWLGLLGVLTRWTALIAPVAGFLWLTNRKPHLMARWSSRTFHHPVMTSIGLVLVGLLTCLIAWVPSMLIAMRLGVPNQNAMARMQVISIWQMVGHGLLEIVLLPMALVWLARRAQTPRSDLPR